MGRWFGAVCLAVAHSVAAPGVAAQGVVLRIHPRPGDTLHMRYDQQVETIGTTHRAGGDSTTTMLTTLLVLSRTIVVTSDTAGTDVIAVTDSVSTTTSGDPSAESADVARRMLQGKRVHLRLAPDGATAVSQDSGAVSPQLKAVFAAMPAVLPRQPITVGERWTRAMGPLTGALGRSELRTTFRLDSVARGGDTAYVSIRGTLSEAPGDPGPGATAAAVESSGTLSGTMRVDLRRGWVTESRATIGVTSIVSTTQRGQMRIKMTVTQWLRTID